MNQVKSPVSKTLALGLKVQAMVSPPSTVAASTAEKLIVEHNHGCLEACGKTTSHQYVKDSRRCDERRDCPDCPKDWMIEFKQSSSTAASTEPNLDMMRLQLKVIDADRMAAIVDEMVRAGRLDARSKLADARLDYGKPWDPTHMREGAEMLAATRDNADYWLKGARDESRRDEAVMAAEQSVNAWRDAAYAMAERLARLTSSATPRGTEK